MSDSKRILIVEDEADLANLLGYNLRRAGYQTEIAHDGRIGLQRINEDLPDLVILDVMLPHMSGLQVAKQLRTNPKTSGIPVLMLTAKAEELDEISGLQVGADDYVTKPFSVKVLLARIEAMLRRSRSATGSVESGDVLEVGPLKADLSTHDVWADGELVRLTLTEFRLLTTMMRKPGKAARRADLMYSAMGPGVLVTARTIDVHMASIRKKLARCGSMIRTIRGVGYLLSNQPATPGEAIAEEEAAAETAD